MPPDDAQRQHLYDRIEATMDRDAADTFMSFLPPSGEEHATRRDLEAAEARLHARIDQTDAHIDQVEARLTARIDQIETGLTTLTARTDQIETTLTTRMDQIETKLTTRMDQIETKLTTLTARMDQLDASVASLQASFTTEIAAVEHRLIATLHAELAAQTRWMLTAFVTSLLAFGSLIVAATQLAA
jgi:outer membrane murein-binding lipoprotein Lpp